jgi:hypothetical protein
MDLHEVKEECRKRMADSLTLAVTLLILDEAAGKNANETIREATAKTPRVQPARDAPLCLSAPLQCRHQMNRVQGPKEHRAIQPREQGTNLLECRSRLDQRPEPRVTLWWNWPCSASNTETSIELSRNLR